MTGILRSRPLLAAIVAFVLLLVLLGSFPIIPETKQAVVVRFGKPVRIYNQFKAGRPIGAAYRIPRTAPLSFRWLPPCAQREPCLPLKSSP